MDMDFDMFQQLLDSAKNKSDNTVAARFYDRLIKSDKLDENGLPVFDTVCFVEIRMRDCHDVFDQPADADKIQRFPTEYNRYLLAKKQVEKGAPLDQFAFLTAAEIETLKFRGIFTVEALAGLDEEKARLIGVLSEHKAAKLFLQQAKGHKALIEAQKREERYLAEIDFLKSQIEKLRRLNNRAKK